MKRPAAIFAMVIISGGMVLAQNTPPSRVADETAIRAASQALAAAFAKGDAKAVAAAWTDEGEYVDEGGPTIRGRIAIEKAYADFFAKKAAVAAEVKTDKVRFLGTDTAIEEGTFTVKAKNAPNQSSKYSALFVRQGGKWQIALLKEWTDDAANKPSLESLGWLSGTWESEGESPAKTTYDWGVNKKFLACSYSVTPKKGEPPSQGMQIIGVHPATGAIHSWTFDAHGGIGEAIWKWDGERWVIDSRGFLPNGSTTTARNLLTRTADDAFTWRSVLRTVDGQKQPDIDAIKVKKTSK